MRSERPTTSFQKSSVHTQVWRMLEHLSVVVDLWKQGNAYAGKDIRRHFLCFIPCSLDAVIIKRHHLHFTLKCHVLHNGWQNVQNCGLCWLVAAETHLLVICPQQQPLSTPWHRKPQPILRANFPKPSLVFPIGKLNWHQHIQLLSHLGPGLLPSNRYQWNLLK